MSEYSLFASLNAAEAARLRLLEELADLKTTHSRRRDIGKLLNEIGDTRLGVNINDDGVPDILWLPVTTSGEVQLKNGDIYDVQPLYIAAYEVTYVQYEAFVKASDGYNELRWWDGIPEEYSRGALVEQTFKTWNSPRDNISLYQSVAFSRWLNWHLEDLELPINENDKLIVGQNAQIRLPLEWEWQWAAQGGNEKRSYPWGHWQDGYANTREANLHQTVAVGMYPQGRAICGACDMAGNIEDWCLNKYAKSKPYRMIRGGSFQYRRGVSSTRANRFNFTLPYFCSNFIGFRLILTSSLVSESDYL